MAGRVRAPVRSSARLSTGTGTGLNNGAADAAAGQARASAEAAALAAHRRARARERAMEVEDSPRVLRDKCRRLARALRNAKHLVVYTGAGISTAADIPDYRGPRGVWTRLQRGEAVGRVEVSRAQPTLTHMALTALWERGTLKFVVSQNCDGLHVRAGLPRTKLAELHGNMFAERCRVCRKVYLRAFDTTERTARHAHGTRRLCHQCGAELHDSIVHFGERGRAAWPLNWAGALRHAARADVVLCLGSSLKVLRRYPRLWRMQHAPHARPALYIVNLQWTPKDAVAALKINARCDAVMAQLARRLRLRVPRYSPRRDPLLAHAVPLAPQEEHTTRRPLLRAPSAGPSDDDSSSSSESLSSPSASDSDEELPLRRLAERLRPPPLPAPAPAPAPVSTPPPSSPPPPPPPPPPDLLHAFQVSMCSGDATILLRAHHAPSVPTTGAARGERALSDLRRFRFARPPPPVPVPPAPVQLNGHGPPPAAGAGAPAVGARLRHLLQLSPRLSPDDVKQEPPSPPWLKRELKQEWDGATVPKREKGERRAFLHDDDDAKGPKASVLAGEEAAAHALAAAIIARTVLLCRAQLYPGLHTIIAPSLRSPRPSRRSRSRSPSPVACAWCAAMLGARRCQWYGPPPSGERRVWRRVRGRRWLCFCCGDHSSSASAPAPAPAGAVRSDDDGGGWYGKGYRKGRRRRR